MSTGIKETIDETIFTWQKAFEIVDYHNKWCNLNTDDKPLGGFHGN